ncbi:MAG: hypothetical protein J5928_05875, partial [Firmicutes bacterium]|nr:hypothetical protein [Bacillota bacterium]
SLLMEQEPEANWSVAMRPLEDDTASLDDLNGITDDQIEYQEGYTAIELAAAIYQQQRLVKDLDLSLRRSRLNLNMQKEQIEDGVVKAKRDGTVTVLGDPNNLPQDGSAFLKVEAGQGVVIQGGISELMLDKFSVGQEVTAYSWETGQMYLGTISSIDEYPMENNYYYYGGNPNSSTYGFLAYFEDADNLSPWDWVQLTLVSDAVEGSINIPTAYIRSDQSGKYVMKDVDGKLVKQYVRCGKTWYGEYVQILEGIREEDYISFPYGNGAIEGAKTVMNEDMYYYW